MSDTKKETTGDSTHNVVRTTTEEWAVVEPTSPDKVSSDVSEEKDESEPETEESTPTDVVAIFDASGSMSSGRNGYVSTLNEYTCRLVDQAHPNSTYTLTFFDTERKKDLEYVRIRKVRDAVSLKNLVPLKLVEYQPDGMTPLYETIMRVLAETEERKSSHRKMVIILTDGHDNSHLTVDAKATREEVRVRIEALKEQGWQFVFLGVGLDACAMGRAMGVEFNVSCDDQKAFQSTIPQLARATTSCGATQLGVLRQMSDTGVYTPSKLRRQQAGNFGGFDPLNTTLSGMNHASSAPILPFPRRSMTTGDVDSMPPSLGGSLFSPCPPLSQAMVTETEDGETDLPPLEEVGSVSEQ